MWKSNSWKVSRKIYTWKNKGKETVIIVKHKRLREEHRSRQGGKAGDPNLTAGILTKEFCTATMGSWNERVNITTMLRQTNYWPRIVCPENLFQELVQNRHIFKRRMFGIYHQQLTKRTFRWGFRKK